MGKGISLSDSELMSEDPFDTLTMANMGEVLQGADLAEWLARTRLETSGVDGHVLTVDSGAPGGFSFQPGGGAATIPPGIVWDFAGSSIPDGWLPCDGAAVSRTTYAALFAAIADDWGPGDGSTTFNVPDLRGRTTIGDGTGSGLTARTLGDTGGEEEHQLTVEELAAHTHDLDFTLVSGTGGLNLSGAHQFSAGTSSTTGEDEPHNNMPPFGVVKKIIKT